MGVYALMKEAGYPRLENIGEFSSDIAKDNSLWDTKSDWIGKKYRRSFTVE